MTSLKKKLCKQGQANLESISIFIIFAITITQINKEVFGVQRQAPLPLRDRYVDCIIFAHLLIISSLQGQLYDTVLTHDDYLQLDVKLKSFEDNNAGASLLHDNKNLIRRVVTNDTSLIRVDYLDTVHNT